MSTVYAMSDNTPLVASAQASATQQGENEPAGGGARSVTRDEVNLVARELWCPLCSGVRLDTCELKACEQMREEIAIQLAEGTSTEEIKEYFLAQYGPQILGEPPRSGFNWLAWITPFVVLLGGAVYLLTLRQPQPQSESPTDGSQLTPAPTSDMVPSVIGMSNDVAPAAPTTGATTDTGSPSKNIASYEQLLDQELERYDE